MVPQTLIDITGWIYLVTWALGFYGQLFLNFRLKKYRWLL